MKKLIITAAVVGGGTTREQAPHLPLTPDEIAADVVNSVKSGAAIAHIHARDGFGNATLSTKVFTEIYEKTVGALDDAGLDAIINLSTSGILATGESACDEDRLAFVKAIKPEMCSFNAGTLNWNFKTLNLNTPAFLEQLGKLTLECGIKPEMEIFDLGMISNVKHYIKTGVVKAPCHFQLILGCPWAMPTEVKSLVQMVETLPEGSTWAVTGEGDCNFEMVLAGLAMGADAVRVGLEDFPSNHLGKPTTNAYQVERVVKVAQLMGREIATADEAREMLGVRAR